MKFFNTLKLSLICPTFSYKIQFPFLTESFLTPKEFILSPRDNFFF